MDSLDVTGRDLSPSRRDLKQSRRPETNQSSRNFDNTNGNNINFGNSRRCESPDSGESSPTWGKRSPTRKAMRRKIIAKSSRPMPELVREDESETSAGGVIHRNYDWDVTRREEYSRSKRPDIDDWDRNDTVSTLHGRQLPAVRRNDIDNTAVKDDIHINTLADTRRNGLGVTNGNGSNLGETSRRTTKRSYNEISKRTDKLAATRRNDLGETRHDVRATRRADDRPPRPPKPCGTPKPEKKKQTHHVDRQDTKQEQEKRTTEDRGHAGEKKRENRKARRHHSDVSSRMPQWPSMVYRWEDMFHKKFSWSPQYALPGNTLIPGSDMYTDTWASSEYTDSSGDTELSSDVRRRRIRKFKLAAVVIVFFLLLIILIPSLVLSGIKDKDPGEDIGQYYMELKVDNRNYTSQMKDKRSTEFLIFAEEFTDEVDTLFEGSHIKTNYLGVTVNNLSQGSVIISFTIHFYTDDGIPLDNSVIISVFTTSTTGTTTHVTVGTFVIATSSVSVVSSTLLVVTPGSHPYTKPQEIDFSGACTEGQDKCKTPNAVCKNSLCRCFDGYYHSSTDDYCFPKIAYASDCAGGPDEVCLTSGSVCTDVCTCTVNKYYHQEDDSCKLINCGPVPSIDRGEVASQTSLYGDKLSITCDNGYELSETNNVVCSVHDTWDSLPSCNVVKCNEKPALSNGTVTSDMEAPHIFMDTIKFICDDGYERSGPMDSFCQANKTWSPVPTCDPVICKEFVSPDNSETVPVVTSGLKYNDQITAICLDGYEISGNNEVICQSNKEWSEAPLCNPKYCSVYLPPTNAILDSTKPIGRAYLHAMHIQCELGYERNGPNNVSCTADQTWTESPSCNPVNCSTYEAPSNGSFDTSKQVGMSFEETIHINCNEGYEIEGPELVTCEYDKSWSVSPSCNPVNCSQFEPPINGYIDSSKHQGSSYNETIYVTCNPGFALSGPIFVICQSNQTWSDSPNCNRKNCSEYIPPSNGTLDQSRYTGSSYEDDIYILCNTGYEIEGPEKVTCTENEHWSISPSCNPSNCSTYTAPAFSNIDANKTQGMSYQETVHLTCTTGYEMEGHNIVTCQSNKAWTQGPSCNPVNCTIYSPPGNGSIDKTNTIGSTYHETININCDKGYVIEGQPSVLCQSDKTWTQNPSCNPVNCSAFQLPEHGYIDTNFSEGASYNETIHVLCEDGYNIDGSPVVFCQADESWTESGICNPITCDPLEAPANSMTIPTITNGLTYGTTANVTCNKGFTMTGVASIVCNTDGSWTESPTCDPVECLIDILPDKRDTTSETADKYVYLDKLSIKCQDGFNIEGEPDIECNADGTWSSIPTCDRVICPVYQTDMNLFIKVEQEIYYFEDSITVACRSGYGLDGIMVLRCEADASWSGAPQCVPSNCTAYITPENGHIVSAEKSIYVYGDSISIECNEGYNLKGNDNVHCLSDKMWSETPTCEPLNCSNFILPANAIVESDEKTEYLYGDIVTLSCSPGFELVGDSVITCQSNQMWSEIPTCRSLKCPSIFAPINGRSISELREFYVSGDIMIFECDDGYLLDGSDNILCLENQTWSEVPTCDPVECLIDTLPDKRDKTSETADKYVYLDELSIQCLDGFNLKGEPDIDCTADGTWSSIPTCDRVICPVYQTDVNMFIEVEQDVYYFEDSITVACHSGYELDGANVISCEADATWSGAPQCVPSNCTAYITPENGHIVSAEKSIYVYGDIISIECNEGYNLKGNDNMHCLSDTMWSETPTCEPLNCSNFILPADSVVESVEKTEYLYGDIVTLSCSPGFELVGDSVITCQSNQMWSEIPTCRSLKCPSIFAPINGRSISELREFYVSGDIMIFECDDGYLLDGSDNILCLENQTWSEVPTCDPVECLIDTLPDKRDKTSETADKYVYLDELSIQCLDGFNLKGEPDIDCTADGTWSSIPTCDRVICPVYQTDVNMFIEVEQDVYYFEDSITVACHSGYELDGANVISCEADATWSGAPQCVPSNCTAYITPENGHIVSAEKSIYVYGDIISIECNEGYNLKGNDNMHCLSDTMWSETPTCEPLNCSNFILPADSVVESVEKTEYLYGDIVTLSCSPGFELEGDSDIICQSNQMWSEIPTCRSLKCPSIFAPINGRSISEVREFYVSGDIMIFECDDGYLLDGSDNILCLENQTWSEVPTCDPVECLIDTLPDKRDKTSETADKYVYLDELSIQCLDGFNLKGKQDIDCTADGTWSSIPTCDRVICPVYQTDVNMFIEVEQDVYYFEDSITVACHSGYELDGANVISCEADVTWSGDSQCVPSNCTTYITPENGQIVSAEKHVYVYGDIISIKCNEGYKLKGNDTVHCLSDTMWSETPTCEPLNCSNFILPANSIVESVEKIEYFYGDIVVLRCSDGFELEGNSSFICLSNQTWSEIPICGSLKCPSISGPKNGKMNSKNSVFYVSGDNITFECDEGYLLVGSDTIVCLDNQTWTEVPTCDPVDCESYTTPDNSEIVNENGTLLGAVIDIECKSGYNHTGKSTAICQTSGNWSDFPTCTAVDCGPYTFPNRSKVHDEYESVFMSEINVTCNDGFGLVSEDEHQVVCDADGLWNGTPECNLQGSVSLSTNDQSDTYPDNTIINITCEVSNAVNWKTIIFATISKQTITSDVGTVLKSLITVLKTGDIDTASEKVALLETSVIGETDISLHVQLVGTNCTDSGEYFCILSPEGIQSSISEYENVAYASVDIIVETTPKTPSLKVSSFFYRDEFNTFTCEGDVGSDPDTELSLQIKLNNSNYDFIADEPASSVWIGERHCNIQRKEWNIVLEDTYQGASVRCHTRLAGLELLSESVTIKLATYNDIFFKVASPTAVIGESFTLSCIANNFFNLTEIIIATNGSSIVTFKSINDYTITATDTPENLHIVSGSFLNDTFAEVNVIINTVRCQDKGLYTCSAYTDGELIKDTEATLKIQRYPEIPKLDISLEMVENQEPLVDFPTSCVAQVGYPDGELLLETDKDGTFAAVDLTSSPFSNITYDTNEEECSNIATITYYNIYQLDWQRTNMKCSVQNTATFKEGEDLYVIKIVDIIAASTCEAAPINSTREHLCYGILTCEVDRISATKLCPSTDQCYDSTIPQCVQCEDVGKCYDQLEYNPRRLVCDSVDTIPGSDVTVVCQLYYVAIDMETDNIVVTKGTDIILDTSGDDTVNNDDRFDTTLDLDVQVEPDKVSLLFTPLQWCNQTGIYTITLERNSTIFEDQANVTIINSASTPIITKVPIVYYRDQEITVTCKASFGQPLGNTRMVLKYKQAADASFKDLTNIETTVTYDADHCTHVAIQTYAFIATNETDGDQIQCETTTDGGDMINSEVETITIVEPAIVFERPVLDSFLNDDATIVCQVKDIEDISEVKFGTEDGTVISTLTKTDFINNLVFGRFQIMDGESFINQSNAVLQLRISSVACMDKGKYFCEAKYGSELLPRTLMTFIARRKATVPILDLSIEMIENKSPWFGLQTECTAEVGYPTPGTLVLESDYTGSYNQVDLTEVGSKLEYNRDDDTCSTMATIWFLNTYTMEWDNSNMKCAVRNTTTYGLGIDNELSVTKEVHVIGETYCNGSTGATMPHPFACYAELTCTETLISAIDKCVGDRSQCFNFETSVCEPCESLNKCDAEGIENVPTITTTPIPGQPNIQCNDVTSSVGVDATATCTLLYLNITKDIPVRIQQGGTLILNSADTQGIGTIADGIMFDVQANIDVIVYEVKIEVKFESLLCTHATNYIIYIDVNGAETISASFDVNIKTNATTPVLTKSPETFYRNQQMKITCVGSLGKPVDPTVMVLKTRASQTTGAFTSVTAITSSSEDDAELCSTVKTIEHVLILSNNTDNTQYMCETTTTDGEVLQSEIMTIELTEPVIYFGNDQPIVEIGSIATMDCTITKPYYPDEASGIVITRRNSASFEIEELVRFENGVVVRNSVLTGISSSEKDLTDKLVLTVTFGEIVCEDANEYFCEAITTNSDISLKTRRFLSLKRTATIAPELTLPIELIVDEPTGYSSDHLKCTADVGYPAGDVKIQYRSTDSQTYVDFDLRTQLPPEESEGDCIVNKTVSYRSITFSESHNNTRVKCVVFDGNTAVTESSEQTIFLLNNTCAADDAFSSYYHPYNCHLYNECQSGLLFVRSCNAGCPDIDTQTNVRSSCAGNCTVLCG